MDNEPLKLGRVNKRMETTIKANFGENIFIYIDEKKLSFFALRWPEDYLKKVEEISRIIKKALYIAYDEQGKTLYLIDEYIVKNGFQKVVVEIKEKKDGWAVVDIYSLNDKKLHELSQKAKIYRLI